MGHFLCFIFDKLWPALVTIPLAVLVTQWVAQKLIEVRKPRLEMVPEEPVHSGSWGPPDGSGVYKSFHAWRIKVQHTKIPRRLARVIKAREPALHCKASLTFYDSKGNQKFIMQGRWANTPEPSRVSHMQERIAYPDTIDIGYHDDEPIMLDCIHKFDDEKVTYAWNNESYAYDGKTPTRDFEVGTYRVDVKLSGPNVKGFTTKFDIEIAEAWQGTSLRLGKGQDGRQFPENSDVTRGDENDSKGNKDGGTGKRNTNWAACQAVATILLIAVTASYTFYARQQVEQMKEALRLNTLTFEMAHRPYIGFDSITMMTIPKAGPKRADIRIAYKNFGTVPAKSIRIDRKMFTPNVPTSSDLRTKHEPFVLFPNTSNAAEFFVLDAPTLHRILNGEEKLTISMTIYYKGMDERDYYYANTLQYDSLGGAFFSIKSDAN